MDILKIALIALHITTVIPRKYISSSDESIENLLYYKDCKHKAMDEVPQPTMLRAPEPQREPACPFPKMCCSMTCGNDCGNTQPFEQPFGRQQGMAQPVQPIQPIQPMHAPPARQPQPPIQPLQNQKGRKRKAKFPMAKQQPPLPTRRDFGFTKDKIKSLISQDGDIRKILKDLVRVTIQKVDLLDKLHSEKTESPIDYEGFESDEEL